MAVQWSLTWWINTPFCAAPIFGEDTKKHAPACKKGPGNNLVARASFFLRQRIPIFPRIFWGILDYTIEFFRTKCRSNTRIGEILVFA